MGRIGRMCFLAYSMICCSSSVLLAVDMVIEAKTVSAATRDERDIARDIEDTKSRIEALRVWQERMDDHLKATDADVRDSRDQLFIIKGAGMIVLPLMAILNFIGFKALKTKTGDGE